MSKGFFAEDLFPVIDEELFRVLYSTAASRSNMLVNICIGALIIKEIFDISDAEVVENLMLAPATSMRFIQPAMKNSL